MAYVASKTWDEENPDPRPAPRTASAAYAPSGSAANWNPGTTPEATGMPDLLAYVRANGDQVNAASEKKAGELETRAREAIDQATWGKDYVPEVPATPAPPPGLKPVRPPSLDDRPPPSLDGKPPAPPPAASPGSPAQGTAPSPDNAEKVLSDLNATATDAGRQSLWGEAPTKGGKGLDSYLFGQAGMQPFDQLRSMYGDLLKNARPPEPAPTPPAPDKTPRPVLPTIPLTPAKPDEQQPGTDPRAVRPKR